MMPNNHFLLIFQDTAQAWITDKVPRLGAALAFYSALSIGPLLVLCIAIGGFLFGTAAVSGRLASQMGGLVGGQGAIFIQMVLANAHQPKEGIIATIISVLVLLVSASCVFGELQDAFNKIWRVSPASRGTITTILRQRFLSFIMIMITGFLLLVTLGINAALNFIGNTIFIYLPASALLLKAVTALLSFGFTAVLFAMIFKFLPDTQVKWREVRAGALLTAVLFTAGKEAIGLYLGHSAIGSTYGAAGSLMVFLVWIYYSAQILYFGAEFTYISAQKDINPLQ